MDEKKERRGGRREGAGRKPTPPAIGVGTSDPLEFLLSVMRGEIVPSPAQLKAAETAARVMHGSKTQGKKEQREAAAKEAGEGRFKAASPPRLAAVDGKTVG